MENTIIGMIVCNDVNIVDVTDDKNVDSWKTNIEKNRSGKIKKKKKNEINYLEYIVDKADELSKPTFCKFCSAKKIQYESKGFCCSDGEILLVHSKMPDELYNLFIADDEVEKEFRTYVRTYNNTFAFTSFGVKYDKNL